MERSSGEQAKPEKVELADVPTQESVGVIKSQWVQDAEDTMLRRYENEGRLGDGGHGDHPESLSPEAYGHLKEIVETYYKGSNPLSSEQRHQAIVNGLESFHVDSEKSDAKMYLELRNSFKSMVDGDLSHGTLPNEHDDAEKRP